MYEVPSFVEFDISLLIVYENLTKNNEVIRDEVRKYEVTLAPNSHLVFFQPVTFYSSSDWPVIVNSSSDWSSFRSFS